MLLTHLWASTSTCKMGPTSTLLPGGGPSGSVPGFREYGDAGTQGPGEHTTITFASALSLAEGRDSFAFELCSPTSPHDWM